eukprot:3929560-Pleurochrysis_carterae.AAC.2
MCDCEIAFRRCIFPFRRAAAPASTGAQVFEAYAQFYAAAEHEAAYEYGMQAGAHVAQMGEQTLRARQHACALTYACT